MKEFGAALKQAREEAGLTLEQIHDRTRINLKHLRAIENGDFPSVPPTYVRAFIKEFARMVGLDETATVDEYNELAEELKGIPKPPEAIDHSHLTPTYDDSVEIVDTPPAGAIPKHVEVEGTMEVEEQEFTLPVRRSQYVSDDHKSVDLPSTSRKKDVPPEEPEHPPKDPNQLELGVDEEETPQQAAAPTPEEAQPEEKAAIPQPKEEPKKPEPPKVEQPKKEEPKAAPAKTEPPKAAQPKPAPPKAEPPKPTAPKARQEQKPAPPKQTAPKQSPPKQAKPAKEEKKSLAAMMPFGKKKADKPAEPQMPAKQPKKRTPEDEEQRRLIIIGSLITVAIVIGIYGIVYFSEDTTPSTATADSTRTQPNVYAERFIDSTDFIPDEPEILPDTTTGAAAPQQGNQNAAENVYASEDSLILEAFSSTPVYFSIRMDTTKTEKGFLSKNEHRVWKAKDRFVISLGDAGAMTFFLNGKQLRSLGGEGLAINNHVINRKTIDQE